ncbi:MAG: riboflavin biosynthesis protein RibD [Spirochaetes bacterium GWF1_41_5]|nr:MAG: riboflavin biosynthesis protein RibD [Spirochaetes bacterium GWF1_41_5]HBE01032.1 bifunctional diaminohydroxyphosphoribosylaminopyrimidine deaminase/5-amino-6-(5-phosphoribosylamino)uracil reductase RibD [Spirochaetia bacterium]
MNFCKAAMELAFQAKGYTSPNPAVGAVVVKNSRIIGRGSTSPGGRPHAEYNAIINAGISLCRGALLYVTLEPCSHFGKTPPCTDIIKTAGIKKVIIAGKDPNPLAAAQTGRILKQAGITAEFSFPGEYAKKLQELNEDFFKYIITSEPFVSIKYAMTLEGKIALGNGDSRWISSPAARCYVHYLRRISDAVMTGAGTVRADNPRLDARYEIKKKPLRVIVARNPDFNRKNHVLSGSGPTLFIIPPGCAKFKKQADQYNKYYEEFPLDRGEFNFKKIFRVLAEKYNCISVLAEGGGYLLGSILTQRAADKLYAFIAPKLTGGGGIHPFSSAPEASAMAKASVLYNVQTETFENNVLFKGYFNKNDHLSKP